MPRPLREFLNDFRLAAWYVGLIGACVVAAITGTYWGWWAYMWGVALPIRVVGVVAISASVFVCWFGALFTSHYYFGFPRRNPLFPSAGEIGGPAILPLRLSIVNARDASLFLNVINDGLTDQFTAQITYMLGTEHVVSVPFSIRWEYEDSAKHEIVKGNGHHLQVLSIAAPQGDSGLELIEFFGPRGSEKLRPVVAQKVDGAYLYAPIEMLIAITSATTGSSLRIDLVVEIAMFGTRLFIRPYLLAENQH